MSITVPDVSQRLAHWATRHPEVTRIVAFGCDDSGEMPPETGLELYVAVDPTTSTDAGPYFAAERWVPEIRRQLGFGVNVTFLPPGKPVDTTKRNDYFVAYERRI